MGAPKVRIVLPAPPSQNQTLRMARGRIYRTKKWHEYKETIAKECLISGVKKLKGELFAKLRWNPDKKFIICEISQVEASPPKRKRRPDIDNMLKHLLDAMQGSLFENDNQIVKIDIEATYD